MISGADRSGHAQLVLPGAPASSGWCAQVVDGAQGSVINPVSNDRVPGLSTESGSTAAHAAKEGRTGVSDRARRRRLVACVSCVK